MKPLQFALEIPLDDVYKGTKSKMRVTRMRICKTCKGYVVYSINVRKGCKPGAEAGICGNCKGKKIVTKLVQLGPGMYSQSRGPCEECSGRGDTLSEEDRCKTCKGEKIQEEKKEFEVKVDPGVPDNHVYTFAGEGHETVQ